MFTQGHAGSGNLLIWHEVTMTQYKEFQGKTLDDAIKEACDYYGVARSKLEIEIVSDAKTGIFGLVGVKKATIRAARVQLGDTVSQLLETPAPEAASSAQEGEKGAKRRPGTEARPDARGSAAGSSSGGRKSSPEPQEKAEDQGHPDPREKSGAGSDVNAQGAKSEGEARRSGGAKSENVERKPGGAKGEREARRPGGAKSEGEARRPGGAKGESEERKPDGAKGESGARRAGGAKSESGARKPGGVKSGREAHGGSGDQGRAAQDSAQARTDAETDRDEERGTPRVGRAPMRKGIAAGRGRIPGGALRPARGGAQSREDAPDRAGERDNGNGRGPAGGGASGEEAADAARHGQERFSGRRADGPFAPAPEMEEQADALEGLRDDLPDFDLENCDRDQLFAVVSSAVLRLAAPIVGQVPCVVSVSGRRIRASLDCGEASGLLVGRDGQTLAAIEYLATRIVSRQLGGAVRLQVDAGKYRERQDDKLKELALSLAAKARESGRSQSTRPLSAYQRRIVHLALEGDPTVQTRSKGEGTQRRVVVLPRRESSAEGSGPSGKGMTAGAEIRAEEARSQTALHKSVAPSAAMKSRTEDAPVPSVPSPPSPPSLEQGIAHAGDSPAGPDLFAAGADEFPAADRTDQFPVSNDAGLLAGLPDSNSAVGSADSSDA